MAAADPHETGATVASSASDDAPPPSDDVPKDPKTVDIYPYSTDVASLAEAGTYAKIQRVHIIRHAEGTHNVERRYRDVSNLDARLTDRGRRQCRDLAREMALSDSSPSPPSGDGNDAVRGLLRSTGLVVTSPLTRCIETALLALPTLASSGVPFVAREDVRETVNYACDRRRRISDLPGEFRERVDFGEIACDHDEVWESYVRRVGSPEEHDACRESGELHAVAERARSFFAWLGRRPEDEVVVCTHSAFLRCCLSFGLEGGVEHQMDQILDEREVKRDVPVVRYRGDGAFEAYMRSSYENCELRSMVVAHRI